MVFIIMLGVSIIIPAPLYIYQLVAELCAHAEPFKCSNGNSP